MSEKVDDINTIEHPRSRHCANGKSCCFLPWPNLTGMIGVRMLHTGENTTRFGRSHRLAPYE